MTHDDFMEALKHHLARCRPERAAGVVIFPRHLNRRLIAKIAHEAMWPHGDGDAAIWRANLKIADELRRQGATDSDLLDELRRFNDRVDEAMATESAQRGGRETGRPPQRPAGPGGAA